MRAPELDEEETQLLYNWADEIPLSRPKKNITRDFADGCLMAEVVHHFIPKIVELHNYSAAHSAKQKNYNWSTLNLKVMKKLKYHVGQEDIDAIIGSEPMAVERVLRVLQGKISNYLAKKKNLKTGQPIQKDRYTMESLKG